MSVSACRYDRDESGELDFDEFKRAMRRTVKISPAMISDKEVLLH